MFQQAITTKAGGREGAEQNDQILQVRPWQYSQHL